MDPRLLDYYERELRFVREMGGEFADAFPKIAGRLGLDSFECADPYVERLLEGFAFLAARVQLKLDAEFPKFTQHLLESIYPHYLQPIPSMAVVQLEPDFSEGVMPEGFPVPRATALRSSRASSERTACEYRTAHAIRLWPLEISEVRYLSGSALEAIGVELPRAAKAALRLRLSTVGEVKLKELKLDRLPLYLRGADELRVRLFEELIAHGMGVIAQPGGDEPTWHERLPRSALERLGCSEDEAILPPSPRSFEGYRLLAELFAFPDRYLFVELRELAPVIRRCDGNELVLDILLERHRKPLDNALDKTIFALHCTPAVNLFPRRSDRVHLTNKTDEHHVIVDRTRPMDYEVHSIREVTGFGAKADPEQSFLPFYSPHEWLAGRDHRAFYTLSREPRVLSETQKREGARTSYIGSETFVSLVDGHQAPYRHDLRQLGLMCLCTNRDLPLLMPVGKGETDFTTEIGAPTRAIRCLSGPTRPRPSFPQGETAWRLISHLSLNYLSLVDSEPEEGAAALRALLSLYGDSNDPVIKRQIEGVRSIRSRRITERLPTKGQIVFARGLEIRVELDPAAFAGSGVFLLGAVLERFFAKYVSVNSFTKTIIATTDGAEVITWPASIGRRHRI